jgi:hypothetical protein
MQYRQLIARHARSATKNDKPRTKNGEAEMLKPPLFDVAEAHRYFAADRGEETDLCLRYSGNEPPFFLGFAYEALARAARAACDEETVSRHLETALKYAALIDDASERAALEDKLKQFRH